MAYDNISTRTSFIKFTGKNVIDSNYTIFYDSIINPADQISMSLDDQDEIVVVRKFDTSTISDSDYTHSTTPVTANEAWSCWTLPNSSDSGSSMYSINTVNRSITFNTTTADGEWTWTTEQSGRSADIDLPSITATDTIYILRKTYSLDKFVEFTSGSRINANNLNYIVDQLMFLAQEVTDGFYNIQEFNPAFGMPNGVPLLDATGKLDNTLMSVAAEDGIQGTGSSADKIRLNLADDSLAISGEQVKVNTNNTLTSTSTTQPLSANQGKELKATLDALSAGVTYKGVIDIDNGASQAAPSAVAGDTYDIIETDGGGSTITLTNFNSLSVTAGDIIRYSGSAWVEIDTSAAYVRQDGSTPLTGNWNAGTFSITGKTEAVTDSSTKLASTAFVKSLDLADFADVTDYSGGTNGHVLKRVSGAWVSVDPDDGTNGISIHNLKDVQDSAATDGHFLKWDASSSSWVGAATGASTKIAEPLSGGDADGTTDDRTEVLAALNAVGITGGDASTTSIYGSADLLGRHFAVVSAMEVFTRFDFQWRHGRLNWIDTDDAGTTSMLKCPTETNSGVTYLSSASSAGTMKIEVNSASNLAAGDLIQLYSTDTSSSNLDVTSIGGGDVLAKELHYIHKIEGTTLWLRDPLQHNWNADTANSRVIKKGSASNAQQQPHDIIIEDMTFEDTIHNWVTVTDTDVDFNQSTIGAQKIRVDNTTHGLATNGIATVVDVMIDHTNSASKWTGTPSWGWINGKDCAVTVTDSDTCDLNFAGGGAGSFASGQSGNAAGDDILAMFGKSTAIHIENGYRILFRRCRFKGFAGGQVKLTGCREVTFEDCTFEDMKWTGTSGNAIVLKECRDISFTKCTFRNVSHGIAYDGTDSYTAVMGLKIHDCVFDSVTTGVRSINNGIMWDVSVKNVTVNCTAFNPYKNYPIADDDIYATPVGMELIGLKFDIDNYKCDGMTTWDAEAMDVTHVASGHTANYGTGKGWSTRWVTSNHNDGTGSFSLTSNRQPSAAFGLKVKTMGTFDWMKPNNFGDDDILGTVRAMNSCDALVLKNSHIDSWLSGVCISAELGLSATEYTTKGITIEDNFISGGCNGMTVYAGHSTSSGIKDANIKNNKISCALHGNIKRFSGIYNYLGLVGNWTSTNGTTLTGVSSSDDFGNGPAQPHIPHCLRWWQDKKGHYSSIADGDARILQSSNIYITNNVFEAYGSGRVKQQEQESDNFVDLHDRTPGTTASEMVHDVRSKFIIWGRHLGGEQYVRGNTQITNTSSSEVLRSGVVETGAGSITDWYRSNTEHLHIVENTFYEDKLDERPGVNLQQYAAHLIGWDYSNTSNWVNNADGWPKAIANLEANFGEINRWSGNWTSFGSSLYGSNRVGYKQFAGEFDVDGVTNDSYSYRKNLGPLSHASTYGIWNNQIKQLGDVMPIHNYNAGSGTNFGQISKGFLLACRLGWGYPSFWTNGSSGAPFNTVYPHITTGNRVLQDEPFYGYYGLSGQAGDLHGPTITQISFYNLEAIHPSGNGAD